MWKLEKGDIVNCIVAETGELTEGKKYKILNVNSKISQVEIINDKKEKKIINLLNQNNYINVKNYFTEYLKEQEKNLYKKWGN